MNSYCLSYKRIYSSELISASFRNPQLSTSRRARRCLAREPLLEHPLGYSLIKWTLSADTRLVLARRSKTQRCLLRGRRRSGISVAAVDVFVVKASASQRTEHTRFHKSF
jgi:hypothetical protein